MAVARRNPNYDRAECLLTDGVGAMVYIRAATVDGILRVETAEPADFDKMPAIGMIVHKFSGTECLVQYRGSVDGVYAGLAPGEMLFVSDGGGLDNEPPDPTLGDPFKFTQAVGVSLAGNSLNLDPDLTLTRRRYP